MRRTPRGRSPWTGPGRPGPRCWPPTTTSAARRRGRTCASPARPCGSWCRAPRPSDPAARAEIDSGKLAEPFWYLGSPLTTPAEPVAVAAFPTAPGQPRPPLPGVLLPDLPTPRGRLRSLLGPWFTVLAGSRAELSTESVVVPDSVAEALRFGARGAALVRPDGHLAAVLPGGDLDQGLAAARSRALG